MKRRTDLAGWLHDAVVHRPWRGRTHHHRDAAAAVGGTGRCRSHLQEDGSVRALKRCLCRKMFSCLCHSHSLTNTKLAKVRFLFCASLSMLINQTQQQQVSRRRARAGGPFGDVLSLPIALPSLPRDPYVPIRQLCARLRCGGRDRGCCRP